MYKKVKIYYEPHVGVLLETFDNVRGIKFDDNFMKIMQQTKDTFVLIEDVKRIEGIFKEII